MKLKPCNLCGSQNVAVLPVEMPRTNPGPYYSTECLDCGNMLYEIFKTKEEAAEAWGVVQE